MDYPSNSVKCSNRVSGVEGGVVRSHHLYKARRSFRNGSTAWRVEDGVLGGAGDGRNTGEPQSTKHNCSLQIEL